MNHITAGIPRFVLLLVLTVILTGCKGVKNEDYCENGAQVCWNTDDAPYLQVNQVPTSSRMLPNTVDGYRIPTRAGASYTLVVGRESGSLRFHVASGTRVDPGANTIASNRYPGAFTFMAETSVYSVVVEDLGRPEGSLYSIRVYSYDEPSVPLRNSRHLEVGVAPVQVRLVEDELARFDFDVVRGYDYEIWVNATSGAVDTFISSIASVDEEVFEQVDWYGNDGIRFRADHDGRMYAAVKDRGQLAGSDFDIQVVQLWP